MKRTLLSGLTRVVMLLVLLFVFEVANASDMSQKFEKFEKKEKAIAVEVSNDWMETRKDEPIVVDLSAVRKLDFTVTFALVTLDGNEIPCQLDDLDGDTKADELIFLADINAGQTLVYDVKLMSYGEHKQYEPRVYCDMMLNDKKGKHPKITGIEAPGNSYIYSDLYHHGAAFESELTAYRIYFDKRQNIDIYGKKMRRLELEQTSFYPTKEQLLEGYGNDVLWAGSSVGCGSFKSWNDNNPVDIDNVALRGQKIIANGPIRTVVEVKDYGWNYYGDESAARLNMIQRYTIYAGHRECIVDVSFDKVLSGERFCTGVQKVGQQPEGKCNPNGLAMSWGTDYPEKGKKDVFPPETVGLAVYVPERYVYETRTDSLNYLYVIGNDGGDSIRYYVTFCADKETDGFHSANEWFLSLEKWAESMSVPLRVKLK